MNKVKNILFSVLGATALLFLAACAFGALPGGIVGRLGNPWISLPVFVVAGIAVWLFFYFVVAVRGRGLKYVTLVILFTIMCLWLYKNFGFITGSLEATLGTWGMIGALVVLIIVVGIGLFVLF